MAGLSLEFLATRTIRDIYTFLDYSYKDEDRFQKQIEIDPTLARKRENFLERLEIEDKVFDVKMLFNQINHYFAYQLGLSQEEITIENILAINTLHLYEHRADGGTLREDIEVFGRYLDLPRESLYRSAKRLRGLPPRYLKDTLDYFISQINEFIGRCSDIEIAKKVSAFSVLAFITMHPLHDANGRYSRILYGQILNLSGQSPLYPCERSDGNEMVLNYEEDGYRAIEWLSDGKLINPLSINKSHYKEAEKENGYVANQIVRERVGNLLASPSEIDKVEPVINWIKLYNAHLADSFEGASQLPIILRNF